MERMDSRVALNDWRPRNCVWELTLACNLRCEHCGSRAGKARPAELTIDECLRVVSELAELGTELVTLSGGEPTLRRDWDRIARAIADRRIFVNMVTNGAYRDDDAARDIASRAKDAGMCNVGVSIDGTEPVHDHLRGQGTFAKTLAAIRCFRRAGLPVGVLTTVNRMNLPELREIRRIAIDAGAGMWRLQLGKPMGSMGDHKDIALWPSQILELLPLAAELKKLGEIHLAVGDSVGYYGTHDDVLRGRGWRGRKECWRGCQAGMQAIGIEADGGVKGCLSLQAKWGEGDPFVEGNVRQRPLAAIWHDPASFAFNRGFREDMLTGVCAGCSKGGLCRGGARCVSSAFLGSVTEDPYCYYRLDRERRAGKQPSLFRHAAAAAAAVTLSLSSAGCESRANTGDGQPDAGQTPDAATDSGEDAGADAAGGPDAAQDSGLDAGQDSGEDGAVSVDYGVDPCEGVCCECDYGEPPPPECCP